MRRVHALTLLPGDRFRFELDAPEYQLVQVGSIYMARLAGDSESRPVTLTSLMGRNGLMVFPSNPRDEP